MKIRFRSCLCMLFLLTSLSILSSLPVMAASHKTVYKKQNYNHVYDYDYYTTHTHPELAGKSDSYVLKYFIKYGIPRKEQACEAFNVEWYYNQNPDLRYSYETKWSKYYLYYQKKGYKKGAVSVCAKLKNPINYYKIGSKKISLKKIYDFEYFTQHNTTAYKYWQNQDDAGAVKYFVNTGMMAGMNGNGKKDKDSYPYRVLKLKIFPYFVDNEHMVAHVYSSKTKYLILVNKKKHMVYVFEGKKHNWKKIRQFPCVCGAQSSPTEIGKWQIFYKRTFFTTSMNKRCWWFSIFHKDQGFHSVLYNPVGSSSTPEASHDTVYDATMGVSVSGGCVRLQTADAKWIWDNCDKGTTVKVYNSEW